MIAEDVFCASVASSSLPSHCHFCFARPPTLRKCTGCQKMHYCAADCQKADWPDHKAECAIYKELTEESAQKFSDRIRIVLRLVGRWTKGDLGRVEGVNGPLSLSTLKEHVGDAKIELEALMFLENFKKFVKKKVAGDEVIKRIYKKWSLNNFPLTDEFGRSIGTVICIELSDIRHSCKPSIRIVFSGRSACLLPASSDPPPEILPDATYAYVDDLMPRAARQETLKEKFKIRCKCEGCLDGPRNELMESWVCENCKEGWLPAEETAACSRCGVDAEESHIRTCMMVAGTVTNNNHVITRADVAADKKRTLVDMLMNMMTNALSDKNVLWLPSLRYLYKEAIETLDMLNARELGDRILAIYKCYRNPEDITLCQFKYGLAKVYQATGDLKGARSLIDDVVLHRFESAYGRESEIYRNSLEIHGNS